MNPTLDDGQFVLYEPGRMLTPGDVIVVRHPSQPIDLVKRVLSFDPVGLVEVGSDNPDVGTDSRDFGRVDVERVRGTVTISLEWPFRSVARR